MLQKFIKNMTGEHFESEAVQKEKERLKSLFDFLEEVKKEGESRNGISKRYTSSYVQVSRRREAESLEDIPYGFGSFRE